MMRLPRLLILTALAAMAFVVVAAPAAGDPKGEQTTLHLVNEPNVFTDVDPCFGEPAQFNALESGVIHITEFPDQFHITGTLHGTFTLDVLPLGGPLAHGTYIVWFGDNIPKKSNGAATFTLNGEITYPDGAHYRFHQVGHTTFAPNDVPKLEFFKSHCS